MPENVLFDDAFHVLPSVLHIMLVAALGAPYPAATMNVCAVWYGAGYPFMK
jgi:hypothetical protein